MNLERVYEGAIKRWVFEGEDSGDFKRYLWLKESIGKKVYICLVDGLTFVKTYELTPNAHAAIEVTMVHFDDAVGRTKIDIILDEIASYQPRTVKEGVETLRQVATRESLLFHSSNDTQFISQVASKV